MCQFLPLLAPRVIIALVLEKVSPSGLKCDTCEKENARSQKRWKSQSKNHFTVRGGGGFSTGKIYGALGAD